MTNESQGIGMKRIVCWIKGHRWFGLGADVKFCRNCFRCEA